MSSRVRILPLLLIAHLSTYLAPVSAQDAPALPSHPVIGWLDDNWSTDRFRSTLSDVRAFQLPTGALKKVSGVWRPERFQSVSGHLERVTWSVSGLPVAELFDLVVAELAVDQEPVWRCEGRACGNAAQWASRIYRQKLLYGRAEFQRYVVFRDGKGTWVTVFGAARTADRQYLHVDVLTPF